MPARPLGNKAVTLRGRVNPMGLPSRYYFEYGPTEKYGKKTPETALPPPLEAHYHETWDHGPAGWTSWGKGPTHGFEVFAAGGASGGFIRFNEPSNHDHNHDDGIGTLHLAKYAYSGDWASIAGVPSLMLAAGDPDLRGARIQVSVRGQNWQPNGSELQWWTQSQSNSKLTTTDWRHANWAYTGYSLTELLSSGKWEKADYYLYNDPDQWTYGGNNHAQSHPERYAYWSIDRAQGHLNIDFFHMVTFVDVKRPPTGSIDFDELKITYRNYSLVTPINGGRLIKEPASGENSITLTDGWRHGKDKQWTSVANPKEPPEFVYKFTEPVTINAVQLHQHTEWPAKEVEVSVSDDGKTFTPLVKPTLPEKSPHGPNFAYSLDRKLETEARFLKVRILSGFKPEHWGLGEIEVFGTGGHWETSYDEHVNADLEGLMPGEMLHYRLVLDNRDGTLAGEDETYTVPADERPIVRTGGASQLAATTAKLEGRLVPMGLKTQFYFEYGRDKTYGEKTPLAYGGLQVTPRSVYGHLTGLKPDTEYHFRLVGTNAIGTVYGEDASFRTGSK